MGRLTIKLALAHLLRQALASLAVVLGVGFIAGTFIFTDGAQQAMLDRATKLHAKTAVAVFAPDDAHAEGPGLTPDLLAAIRRLSPVAAADALVTGPGGVLGPDGKRLPTGWISTVPADAALQPFEAASGRLPQRRGEIVLDSRTADKYGFQLGKSVTAGGNGGVATAYQLVGTIDMANTQFAGRPFIGMLLDDASVATGAKTYQTIVIAAGSDARDLLPQVQQTVGKAGEVKSHEQLVAASLNDAFRDVTVIRNALLMFGLVSVLTAGFVIANTFNIVLAQRSRQIALLRLVGASRGQAFRSVLAEAALLGVVASLAGLVAGVGISAGLGWVLENLDKPLSGGLVLHTRTMLIALITGIVVTVMSSLVPAWRGTRVPPIAALSDTETQVAQPVGRWRIVVGVLLLAAAVGLAVYANTRTSMPLVAAVGLTTFFGLVSVGPQLFPGLVRLLGLPIRRVGGAWSMLAVDYAARNRRRVAATGTTLVLCVGLISAVVVGAHSVRAGIEKKADQRFGSDFLITGTEIPVGLAETLRARSELSPVHAQRAGIVSGVVIQSSHPSLLAAANPLPIAGNPGDLRDGTAAVTRPLAQARGWQLGSMAPIGDQTLRIIAVLEPKSDTGRPADQDKRLVVSEHDAVALLPGSPIRTIEIDVAPGVSQERAAEVVYEVTAAYPAVDVMDLLAYKQSRTAGLDQLLVSVIALLALAAIIALVGVANTLTLSVVERIREHAMLRAIGMSRRGMRLMLATEALLMAMVGVVLGIGLGVLVAAPAVNLLQAQETVRLEIPAGQLVLMVGVVWVAVLAASVLPARKAVRRSIVAALADE